MQWPAAGDHHNTINIWTHNWLHLSWLPAATSAQLLLCRTATDVLEWGCQIAIDILILSIANAVHLVYVVVDGAATNNPGIIKNPAERKSIFWTHQNHFWYTWIFLIERKRFAKLLYAKASTNRRTKASTTNARSTPTNKVHLQVTHYISTSDYTKKHPNCPLCWVSTATVAILLSNSGIYNYNCENSLHSVQCPSVLTSSFFRM